ncbi:glycerol-3-phosphate 1-O-acyltransferase PlsY [Candidatus Thiodictyon syntrophicum]|jgi:glycerol-3-phosphate acyltransferase PlsY|uniref:Glycerol-3-phosphate acyltransferase n=1 Tax=Candidatus Thiodictyon syntrophicum TaxID=1166950 RepID=A0A2K8UCJ3_9GAMM|nr:glycerol-3-phosphate 1-O-acyltransferase PlsY [Candidatus Thiodictyon syntrophicum]AUB83149.1 acyl-phosphate glycerol 3-phosphate acyltransferase [Candidatus Thiodictyon syntrophicum]
MIIAAALVVTAYLLGSISSAIIVCRLMGLPDPRTQGSNNPGATNVLRIGGKKAAAITLFGDSLKGLIPMLVAHLLGVGPAVLAMTGLAAFIGHLFPVFFGFRGGKGVATALGVQFGLGAAVFGFWVPVGLPVALIWLFVAKVLKFSSLAALISMPLAPLIVWLMGLPPVLIGMQLVMTGLLIWRHRSNIEKLLTGREGRLTGQPGPSDQD